MRGTEAVTDVSALDLLSNVVVAVGGQARPGQSDMADAVMHAMTDGGHLVVQAGTGTGKSFAYLVPALLHSVTADQRVLVSTATLALQRQLLAKDIPTVLDAIGPALPRQPRVVLLKGRGNYLCRLRLQESGGAGSGAEPLFELPGRLEQQAESLRRWADETTTGDRDDLPVQVDARVWRSMSATGRECVGRQRCPVGAECFAEAARESAGEADVIITNHTLLAIDIAGDAAALPVFDVAVIDEAHEFAARMTQAATGDVSPNAIADAVRFGSAMFSEEVRAGLIDAGDAFAAALGDVGEQRLPELPERLVRALALLRDAAHAALTELGEPEESQDLARRQAAAAALTELHDRAGALLAGGDGVVRWSTADPATLNFAPLSVADRIGGGLLQQATVVATSATLQVGGSFTAMAMDWGLPTDRGGWRQLDVGSPFDYPRQGIMYVPQDLPPPGREGHGDVVLARIGALVRAAGGRALVLSSSWRGVDTIAEYLRDAAIPGVELLVQERGTPPAALIAAFAAEPQTVLVGTLSLWQGVDVPGPSCSLVIIDKIPFPRPDDPVLAARSESAEARGVSGFAAVSLPHAGLLLAQGAGRLIRSDTDRGVVAVLDSRLATRRYGSYLMRSMPAMWQTSDLQVVVPALQRLVAAGSDPA